MEHVTSRRLLVGVEVEPASTLRVPRDRERLEPAAGLRDEVLLERMDAEGVGDVEVGDGSVGSVGVDDELPVAAEEARNDAVPLELRSGEVAEHGHLGRGRHGLEVMRDCPVLRLRRMTLEAEVVADVGAALRGRCLRVTEPWPCNGRRSCKAGDEQRASQPTGRGRRSAHVADVPRTPSAPGSAIRTARQTVDPPALHPPVGLGGSILLTP